MFIMGLLFSTFSFAQSVTVNENPKSSWPFYFHDFVPAQIFFQGDNNALTETKVNINLFTGELQYIDNSNTIRILDNIDDIKSIRIAGDMNFIFVDGFVQEVIAQNGDNYAITKRKKGILTDLEDVSGAYGSSTTTSAVDKINDKLIGGLNVFSYPSLVETKDDGISFDPEIKYFLIKGKESFVLNKKNLKQAFDEAKSKKISSFLKKEKIGFKDEKDLARLLDYITSL
jgi:hypothetical protein